MGTEVSARSASPTRTLKVALRVLDESMHFSQYVLKRNRVPVPHTPLADPVVDTLIARRHRFLEARGADLYTLGLYAVILGESSPYSPAWTRHVRHPSKVVSQNDIIEAVVLKVDNRGSTNRGVAFEADP